MAKRVYFAFDYQDVIDFRVNVVRNHNFTKDVETSGYFDHSMWEEAKKFGDLAIKRLINSELKGSTVTAVLIGTNTYARRWVRYEIMKSTERGNRVIGIHVNRITGKDGLKKVKGPNPFEYLGLEVSADGLRGRPTEWDGHQWRYYSDLGSFALTRQDEDKRGRNCQLSEWFPCYDWVANDGYNNFVDWIE